MKQLFILLLLVVTFNCNKNDDDANTSEYAEYITKNKINTDVNFMPIEVYDASSNPQSPSLKLKLISTEIYPCATFSFITTEFKKGSELIIRFDTIYTGDLCLTAFGPAISYVDLAENIDRITFLNGSVIDTYTIEINEEKVTLSTIENNFTNSLYDKTFKYPENSFAYVCGTNTTNTEIYTDFLSVLEQDPNLNAFNFEGEGRIPYPEISSGHWANHPAQYFTYSDLAAFKILKTTLHDYTTAHIEKNSGATIALYGWNNLRYFSWRSE